VDVHPPHDPIHTWRDFLLHLLTITIGLLIALGLEAAVENLHHRHIVREARDNIRHEIEANEKAAVEDEKNLDTNAKVMKTDLAVLRELRKNPTEKGKQADYTFTWSSFGESAWLSARDSGALTYMPTDEVQRFADVYDQQELASAQAIRIFSSEIEDPAPLIAEGDEPFSQEDINKVMRDTAVTFSQLRTLRQIVEELDRQYLDTLKKK